MIYSNEDTRLYSEAAELRAKQVAELALYTSPCVEKKFTEIESSSDEVALRLLVTEMDLKAIQAKVGSKPESDFLSRLSLWEAAKKLVNIGGKTGMTQLAAKVVLL